MRKGPVIHGVLLAGALGLGWQTWTRSPVSRPSDSHITVWSGSAGDVSSYIVEKTNGDKTTVERKPEGYIWGTTVGKVEKPPQVPGVDMPQPQSDEPAGTTHEYPVSDDGAKLFDKLAALKAKRDLGAVKEDWRRSDYGVSDKSDKLTIQTKSGARTLVIGDTVFGTEDRYVFDQASQHMYVVTGDVMRFVTYPDTLKDRKLHGFDPTDVTKAVVTAGGKTRSLARSGDAKKATWADVATPDKPDQTVANFMDEVDGLGPTDYVADAADAQEILSVDYQGKSGSVGKVQLFKRPSATQAGQFDYLVKTERTHIFGKVNQQLAQRVEQGIDQITGK